MDFDEYRNFRSKFASNFTLSGCLSSKFLINLSMMRCFSCLSAAFKRSLEYLEYHWSNPEDLLEQIAL